MNIKTLVPAILLLAAACDPPLDYRAEAPVALQGVAYDSLQALSIARARSLGLTVYASDSAVARMEELNILVHTTDDFMYADHAHGCGLLCKEVDFVIVGFHLMDSGALVEVDAGSYRRAGLLSEWRFVKPSSAIRAVADSLAAAFGSAIVRTEHQ